MNDDFGEDFNFGQLEKEACHYEGLVLHVPEERENYKSPSAPL